jgi:hypothetical protein
MAAINGSERHSCFSQCDSLIFYQNIHITCMLNEFMIYHVFQSIRDTFSQDILKHSSVSYGPSGHQHYSKQLRFPCLLQGEGEKQSCSVCFTSASVACSDNEFIENKF